METQSNCSIEQWWVGLYDEESEATWGDFFMQHVYPWSDGRSIFADTGSNGLRQQPWARTLIAEGLSQVYPRLYDPIYKIIDYPRAMLKIATITKLIQKQQKENSPVKIDAENYHKESATTEKELQEFLAEDLNLPKPTLETENGWLSLDGDIYPCTAYDHNALQRKLQKVFMVEDIEKEGWIKLSNWKLKDCTPTHWYLGNYHLKPTQKQMDTVFDWCNLHDKPFPEIFED